MVAERRASVAAEVGCLGLPDANGSLSEGPALVFSLCSDGYTGEARSSEILHLMSSGKDLSLRAKPHTGWGSEEPGRQTLELIFLVKGLQHAG